MIKKVFNFVVYLSLLQIIVFCFVFWSFKQKVVPNIWIGGIYIGNLDRNQASKILEKNIKIPETIILSIEGKSFEIKSSEIDLKYNFESSANRAYYYPNKISLLFKPVNIGLVTHIDENKFNQSLQIISQSIEKAPEFPSIKIVKGNIIVNKGKNGKIINLTKTREILGDKIAFNKNPVSPIIMTDYKVELDDQEVKEVTLRAKKMVGKKIELSFENHSFVLGEDKLVNFINYKGFDENEITKQISIITDSINRPPQDSVFIFNDEKVEEFMPSKEGVVVNEESLKEIFIDLLTKIENGENITLATIPVTINQPKVKNEDVNNLGINSLLGKGVSYFRGSIPNRVYNINHATSKFKGILVPPGEIFSFNEILGDVSSLTGYKQAYVIKDGKTVLGDGGGVCQVSTTLFRAALNAGLPITERRAHSYRVGYYEQGSPVGLDATVYYPTTDLKFKNNTPAHILIQSSTDIHKSTLIFEIYGTHDNRTSKISKPIVTSSVAPKEDLYIDDPSLPLGQIKQIEYKAWGAKVIFDYKVTKDDEVLTQKTFVSNYQPWQAVYLKGTGNAI